MATPIILPVKTRTLLAPRTIPRRSQTPHIANPNIANPNIANPNIANPNIANTDLSDGVITDGTWAITNTGNTSSAYSVNLIGQSPPQGIALQLIVYGTYSTPLVTPASGCTLITESHFVPVTNIVSPSFTTISQLLQPAANNPTLPGLALKPGETKYVTVRVYDPTTNNPAQALLDYNPITAVTPAVVSQGANTGTTTPPATLIVLTKLLPQATLTGVYPTQTLQATGGSGAYTWSIVSGTLPTGITPTTGGVISGTPTGAPGISSFTMQVKDAIGDIAQQPLGDCRESSAHDYCNELDPRRSGVGIFRATIGDRRHAAAQPLQRFLWIASIRLVVKWIDH
jgi:hypothetical protein